MNPVPLTWRLLTAEELTKVYLDEMRRDFPQSELKPLSMILNSEAAGTAHTWGIYDGDALAAYLLMVRPVGCAMSQLDYFAVLPRYRASGLGAALLAELPGHENGCQAILIEAECPERPRTRPWPSAVWASTPGAGLWMWAGRSISSTPGSGCWCCPAAGPPRMRRPPCRGWLTATAARWAIRSGKNTSHSTARMGPKPGSDQSLHSNCAAHLCTLQGWAAFY